MAIGWPRDHIEFNATELKDLLNVMQEQLPN